MNKAIQTATQQLRQVAGDTGKFIDKFASTSDKLGGRSSETLFGCTGGIVGTLGAIALSYFAGIPLLLLGAPLSALGLVGGILCSRGPRRFRLERRIAENRLTADELLRRIKGLPRYAPKETQALLWRAYESLTHGLECQSTALLRPNAGETRGLALPPSPEPNDVPLLTAPPVTSAEAATRFPPAQ